jgi:acyl-CoA synthetase (NDP forming)
VKNIYKEIKLNFKKYVHIKHEPKKAPPVRKPENSDYEDLTDAVTALEKLPFPSGNHVAVLGSVCGYGSVCADFVRNTSSQAVKLNLVNLSEETRRKIKKAAPRIAFCENPVDIAAAASGEAYAAVLEILLEAPETDMLLCQGPFDVDFAENEGRRAANEPLAEKISNVIEASSKPVIFFCSPGHFFQVPGRKNIVEFPTISRVIRAAQFLVDYKNTLMVKALEASLGQAISFS